MGCASRARLTAAGLGAAGLIVAATATPARADAVSFTVPVQLTQATGGEPSVATDGAGHVFVVGPQGIPAVGAGNNAGAAFWLSRDDAGSFDTARLVGTLLGGGDSDVSVASDDGTVYVADLEAAATAICVSRDHGNSFEAASALPDPNNCTTLHAGQAAPSDDRPWITVDRAGRAYVTYHEFVSAQPLVFRTDNAGQDQFLAGPCGSIVTDPTIESNVPTDVTGGTLVSKPVVDRNGNLYILFTTTTQAENAGALPGAISGSFSQIYLAVSTDHCQNFTDYTVFDGSALGTNTVQFGDIFNVLAIDGASNLYAVGAGYVGTSAPQTATADIFMFVSHDLGKTWSQPKAVTTRGAAANMLPAAVAGPLAGQLAIGYFRSTNGVTNPNDAQARWTYTVAESADANGGTSATFTAGDVNPGFIYHSGDICNSGILCGTQAPGTGNDRSLLDFTSATMDSHGCVIVAFAGNPNGATGRNTPSNTFNFAARQTSGCFPVTAAVTTTATPTPAPTSGVQGLANTSSGAPLGGQAWTPVMMGAGIGMLGLAGGRRRRRGRSAAGTSPPSA